LTPVFPKTDFDEWLVETFDRVGPFTLLIVLLEISETSVDLLRSSYVHVMGDRAAWSEMAQLFSESGAAWNGAAFFRADRAGLINDATARRRLASLGRALGRDRSLLNEGEFFNTGGLRLKIEEIKKN
jgi:hypothetical protein